MDLAAAFEETIRRVIREEMAGRLAWKRHDLKPHSYSSYKSRLQMVSEHATGRVQMKTLKPIHVRRMYGDLRKTYSSTTLNGVHRCLSTALKQAVADRLLTASPLDTVAAPRIETEEQHILQPADLKRLFAESEGTQWHALWTILGTMGLRIGEALALQWGDVDWRDEHLHVHATLSYASDGGLILQPPKTKTSHRKVHMGQTALTALTAHQEMMRDLLPVPLREDVLFPNTTGGLMRPWVAGRALHKDLERAGLPRIRVHDLRHSAASNMLAAGANVKVVQEMLGHKSFVTTLNLYGHTMPAMHREAMALIDKELMA